VQVTQLVGEYQAGGRVKELAESYRVHRDTVSRLLRQADVEPRFKGLTNAQVSEAMQLYRDGWSIRQVAARYDRSYELVRRALLRAGVELRPPNGKPV
jgi:transposase